MHAKPERTIVEDAEFTLFEERAENLSPDEFTAWTTPTPHDAQVIRQLTNYGPKLLSGPRGCGKTTLLLRAAAQLRQQGNAVPIYVNYGRSMFTEPALNQRADADAFFQDWLVSKILVAARDALCSTADIPQLQELGKLAEAFVGAAERDAQAARPNLPGPTALSQKLEEWATRVDARRVVLLLDDAAHAFVPEQQRVFFDFLRTIRTPAITYKAAIYPGVTEFSTNFHVGHDAKLVHAWVSVEGKDYLTFMMSAFERRIPLEIRSQIAPGVASMFAAACFGIPRTFFSMVETYLESWSGEALRSTQIMNTVINQHADQLRVLHRSLGKKLPRYKQYVDVGEAVLDKILFLIRELNESRQIKASSDQILEVAIRHPIDSQLITILGLLEYAGLVRRTNETISQGVATYSKYAVHGCLLVAASAIKYGRQNPTLEQRANALVKTSRATSYKRVAAGTLLSQKQADGCQLVVANCQRCGAPRVLENARFCSTCGVELVDVSLLEELLAASIDLLPLTRRKQESLHAQGLDKVEDLIRDRGLSEISKARRIGPVWAGRIRSVAEEFVGV